MLNLEKIWLLLAQVTAVEAGLVFGPKLTSPIILKQTRTKLTGLKREIVAT